MANQKKNQLKRNERERKRVHQVNDGFDMLRTRLQKTSANKKLSKADTLREAVKYIRHLQTMLEASTSPPSTSQSSLINDVFRVPKDEFDAYFPNNFQNQPLHPQHHPNSMMMNHQIPTIPTNYTSPSSSCESWSPNQIFFSSPYPTALQPSP